MTSILRNVPALLNKNVDGLGLDNTAFNAKLAVTSPGGAVYPLHVDNVDENGGDIRKLTCIIYLNPEYKDGDGGELRLHLVGGEVVDLTPVGGRCVMFWSDEIPHEVLPTAPGAQENEEEFDRYALTIWIPSSRENLHVEGSKFQKLREEAFGK